MYKRQDQAPVRFDERPLEGEVVVRADGQDRAGVGAALVEERVRRRVEIRQENGSVLVEDVDEIDESSRFVLCGRDGKSRHVLDANHLETSGELDEIRRVRSRRLTAEVVKGEPNRVASALFRTDRAIISDDEFLVVL